MTQWMLLLTVLGAYFCTLLSVSLAIYFYRHRHKPLGRAVSYMLFGEAVGMAVVSTFATLEYLAVLPDFPVLASTAVRWGAIAATAASTIHLTYEVRKVLHET